MYDATDPSPAPAYRWFPPSPALDPNATVLEVVVSWGDANPLLAVHLRSGECFRLTDRGRADPAGHHFVHPSVEGDLRLVEHRGRESRVTLPVDAIAVVASLDGVTGPTGAFALPCGAVARVEHAGLRYHLRHVARAEPLAPRRDGRAFGVVTALALAGTIVVGTWLRGLERDPLLAPDDGTRPLATMRGPFQPTPSPTPLPTDHGGALAAGGDQERARGDEGAVGSRRAPRPSRRRATPLPRGASRDGAARLDPMAAVLQRGVFSALGSTTGSPWGALASPDGEVRTTGATESAGSGYAGLGLLGAGWGGGSNGEELVGLGGVRTRGGGSGEGGTGWGSCGCTGGGGRGQRNRASTGLQVRAVPGPMSVCRALRQPSRDTGMGQCSAGVTAWLLGRPDTLSGSAQMIRRVVHSNSGQVRHCYETALTETPNAQGRVTIRWTIDGSGYVSESGVSANETGSAALGVCVANAVQRWAFPLPEGAGPVTVNYPFDLSVDDPM